MENFLGSPKYNAKNWAHVSNSAGFPADNWIIPQNVINTYCYVLTTFTLPRHYASQIGSQVVQPGVGNFNPATDDVSFKAYYQWVPFVLFLQVSNLSYSLWQYYYSPVTI